MRALLLSSTPKRGMPTSPAVRDRQVCCGSRLEEANWPPARNRSDKALRVGGYFCLGILNPRQSKAKPADSADVCHLHCWHLTTGAQAHCKMVIVLKS